MSEAIKIKKRVLRELPLLLQIQCCRQLNGCNPSVSSLVWKSGSLRDRLVFLEMVLFRRLAITRDENNRFVICVRENGESYENDPSFGHELVLREY